MARGHSAHRPMIDRSRADHVVGTESRMNPPPTSFAVQISNVDSHPVVLGRSGIWELLLLVIGIAFAIHGASGAWTMRRWRAHARLAHGLVVDNIPHLRGLGRT